MSQFNNDPEKVLQWLKSSTGWSELPDEELRRGLKSHLDFMKEHDMSKMDQSSKSEFENIALERINSELASAVEKRLDTSDWAALMGHYYNLTKLRNLARECSIQAQATGVILVKRALPSREICKEQMVSTRLQGRISSILPHVACRPVQIRIPLFMCYIGVWAFLGMFGPFLEAVEARTAVTFDA